MRKLNLKKFTLCFSTLCLTGAMTGCQTTEAETVVSEATQSSVVMPASDQTNQGGWVLNQDVSDEFEGTKLDEDKWFIEGQHGDYYIWKGRAPSQFVPENVIVEDGKLKLRTKWEPDYDFIKESYADGGMGSAPYGKLKDGTPMPVTTAGVLTKKRFLHGYMEVKSKVGNAAITGAFWAIGYEQELDIYEQMGNPKNKKGNIREMNSLATAHDWSPPAQRPTNVFQHVEPLPFRTADEFHVYGAEWGVDFLKLFIDGRLVHHFTQDDVGTDWVLNNPMEIWLDSEIFHWLGYPHKEELPVDFEIEYLRVWQKPIDNLLAPAFFGFEGPILFEENPRPLTMVPEDSDNNDYQKFWDFDENSAKYLSIIEGDYATGVNSLELRQIDKNETVEVDKIRAVTPEGAIKLPAGDYILSMKVWADKGRVAKNVYINFEGQDIEVTFDEIDKLERRQWITLEKKVTFTKDSGAKDKLSIEIHKADLPKKRMGTRLRIDDIEMKAVK
ncbi:family 16 glycosylhydrolase [Pseudocolwellia agarivorans]|uniref:family 16 glycosylhydrolase n=1 Tax=Pseudocolwellia agarivorans TaxID=1911682 RepID=UPI0009847959|nr:family 16 glycosylhydrolase [Pseudocolwellia agarivorans]